MKRFLFLSLATLLVVSSTSCSKLGAGKITGPDTGGGVGSTDTRFDFHFGGRSAATSRAVGRFSTTIDIGSGPAAGDSVWINGMLADPMGDPNISWQARRFAGLSTGDGTLDRPFSVTVPNEQRDYQFIMSFKHEGVEYQYLGPITVNGVPLSAWDYTKFVMWRVFRFIPGGAIDPIRDDAPNMVFSECQVTGIVHPDSTALNQPVTGGDQLRFLSTNTRLMENPGIFVDAPAPASWRFPVLMKKGETFLIRANRPAGNSVLPGLNLKNPDGSLLQCINLFDLDNSSQTYFVFEATMDQNGFWHNPRPTQDDRYGRIVIGG